MTDYYYVNTASGKRFYKMDGKGVSKRVSSNVAEKGEVMTKLRFLAKNPKRKTCASGKVPKGPNGRCVKKCGVGQKRHSVTRVCKSRPSTRRASLAVKSAKQHAQVTASQCKKKMKECEKKMKASQDKLLKARRNLRSLKKGKKVVSTKRATSRVIGPRRPTRSRTNRANSRVIGPSQFGSSTRAAVTKRASSRNALNGSGVEYLFTA